MEIAEHVEQMSVETRRVVDRLAVTGLEAAVPTCPGWTTRDLAVHIGMAHRWAAAIIEQRAQRSTDVTPNEARGEVPADEQLIAWVVDGQRHLAEVIANTPPATDFWRFMRNALSSLAFWARRQAHETAIHRVDAELAGDAVSPTVLPLAFAADGIDELVLGFAPRYRPHAVAPTTIHLAATDIDRAWTVAIAEGAIDARTDGDGTADLRIEAAVNDLYLLLWNRAGTEAAVLRGDPAALDTWRAAVAV